MAAAIIGVAAFLYTRRVLLDDELERRIAASDDIKIFLETIYPQISIASTAVRLHAQLGTSAYLEVANEARDKVGYALSEIRQRCADAHLCEQIADIPLIVEQRLALLDSALNEAGSPANASTLARLITAGAYQDELLQQKIAASLAFQEYERTVIQQQRSLYQWLAPTYTWFIIIFSLVVMMYASVRLRRSLQTSRSLLGELQESNVRLRHTNQQLGLAEDLAKIGTWEVSHARDYFFFSDNLYRLHGIDPNAGSNQYEAYMRLILPEDRGLFDDFVNRVFSDPLQPPIVFRALHKDGTIRYMKAAAMKTTSRSGDFLALGTTQDVTEEYLLQQALKDHNRLVEDIIDNSHDMIVVLNRDLRVTVWNRATEEAYGLQRQQVIGESILALFPEVRFDERDQHLADVLNGRSIVNEDVPYVKGYCQLTLLPLRSGGSGAINGVLIICHDITEVKRHVETQKQLNSALRESNQKLQQANLSLEEHIKALKTSNSELEAFGYAASHDLQEPLRRIQAFADMILKREQETLSVNALHYFSRIQAAASRMQQLIEDLLIFSEVKGQQEPFSTVDLNALIRQALLPYQEMVDEGVVKLSVAPTLPQIQGSEIQMIQLFSNLIGNAVKYRKVGEPLAVTITSEQIQGEKIPQFHAEPGRKYYKIEVIDNGIGFSQEYAGRIFELFVRLHDKETYQGTGVGLAICKRVVENHRGFIATQSVVGKGSVFTVILPVERRSSLSE